MFNGIRTSIGSGGSDTSNSPGVAGVSKNVGSRPSGERGGSMVQFVLAVCRFGKMWLICVLVNPIITFSRSTVDSVQR